MYTEYKYHTDIYKKLLFTRAVDVLDNYNVGYVLNIDDITFIKKLTNWCDDEIPAAMTTDLLILLNEVCTERRKLYDYLQYLAGTLVI